MLEISTLSATDQQEATSIKHGFAFVFKNCIAAVSFFVKYYTKNRNNHNNYNNKG